MPGWAWFLLGSATTLAWVLILALCAAAGRADEVLEREQREWRR